MTQIYIKTQAIQGFQLKTASFVEKYSRMLINPSHFNGNLR